MKLPYENLARGISFYANYRLESSFSFFTDESRDLWRFARGRGRREQRRILCVETRLKRADEHLAFQHRGCCKCSALNGIYRPVLHTRFANKLIHYKRSRVFIHPPSSTESFTDRRILSVVSKIESCSEHSFLSFLFVSLFLIPLCKTTLYDRIILHATFYHFFGYEHVI